MPVRREISVADGLAFELLDNRKLTINDLAQSTVGVGAIEAGRMGLGRLAERAATPE